MNCEYELVVTVISNRSKIYQIIFTLARCVFKASDEFYAWRSSSSLGGGAEIRRRKEPYIEGKLSVATYERFHDLNYDGMIGVNRC